MTRSLGSRLEQMREGVDTYRNDPKLRRYVAAEQTH